jgi:hypothetical protein
MKKMLVLLLCVASATAWSQNNDYVEYTTKGKMESVQLLFPLKTYALTEGLNTYMVVQGKKVKVTTAEVNDYNSKDARRNTPTDILNNYMIKDKKPGASIAELYTRKTEIFATRDNKIMAFWYNENPQGEFPAELKMACVTGNSIIQLTLMEPLQDSAACKRLLMDILGTANLQEVAAK